MTVLTAQSVFSQAPVGFGLIIHHHLGLGDHFICNGLVHSMRKRLGCSRVYLLTKPEYACTVGKLYEDFPDVQPIALPNEYRLRECEYSMRLSIFNSLPLLKVSFMQDDRTPFDLAFYRQLGIDFRNRWSEFRAPQRNPDAERFFRRLIKDERYCLVANQSSVGEIEIEVRTELPMYHLRLGMRENLLDWLMVIRNAAEIHCVDSAALHLIDSLDLAGRALFYHDTRKGLFHCLNDWKSVDSFAARIVPIRLSDPMSL